MLASGLVSANLTWHFMGSSRRQEVVFQHNTLTGNQRLFVNGHELFKSGWQYKLTGNLSFTLDDRAVEVLIRSDAVGNLTYALSVNNKEIPPSSGGLLSEKEEKEKKAKRILESVHVSTWVFSVGGLNKCVLHQVELHHQTMDVLLDGVKIDAVADFIEEGSSYAFLVDNVEAIIHVIPLSISEKKTAGGAPGSALKTMLTLGNGIGLIPQSELLGVGGTD